MDNFVHLDARTIELAGIAASIAGGCRDTTDICPNENVLGFPFKDFESIVDSIEFLNQKAITNSRGKNALAMLKRKETADITKTDPFQE